jgi:DNA transformation protein
MSKSELLNQIEKNITEFPITSRKMFGGIGVFSEDVMFALIYDKIVYLKSTLEIAKTYSGDSTQFEPPFRRPMKMPYWSVPKEMVKDQNQFAEWANKSLKYAKMTKKKK